MWDYCYCIIFVFGILLEIKYAFILSILCDWVYLYLCFGYCPFFTKHVKLTSIQPPAVQISSDHEYVWSRKTLNDPLVTSWALSYKIGLIILLWCNIKNFVSLMTYNYKKGMYSWFFNFSTLLHKFIRICGVALLLQQKSQIFTLRP